ncbi:MAG: RNA methyltransferase [Pirellulales bacterium]|nr:RNA methyltransferase [Pirellulales bacterium]
MQITSVQNPRVKSAAKLRSSRERVRQQRIVIDGVREIQRAVQGGVVLREVFVCDDAEQSPERRTILKNLAAAGVAWFTVTSAVFAKIAFGDRREGIVAVADMPQRALADFEADISNFKSEFSCSKSTPLVAVLEGIEKPGNVGAVLRSADGAGASAVILADAKADVYSPNTIRASLGTVFTLPVFAASTQETLAWLRQNKLATFAARVDGAVGYETCDFRRPCAMVLGSEAQGLTAAWSSSDISAIRLPMRGSADSLNVSAAAAVLFYEALRQRSH